MRLGESQAVSTDTRILATTMDDLEDSVEKGIYRADLYYRLRTIYMEIPPLRKRGEDIPLLAKHFMKRLRRRGAPHYRIQKAALSALCAHPFPGNVLELKNIIHQVLSITPDEHITLDILSQAHFRKKEGEQKGLEEVALREKEIIEDVVKRYPRDLDSAARELGISRTTLWRRMKKYKLLASRKERQQAH